ncbi:hypothetical protein [Aeoliella sp. SH292]|uniref:hypothetical protein n=1 Tax=Aeoliella sp. SH292 TaxID=3454464 RepID=UPI003F9AC2C6
MQITEKQLEKIAAWEIADQAFVSVDPIVKYIQPAITELTKSGHYDARVVANGGLSNYYSVALTPSFSTGRLSLAPEWTPYHGPGLLIYLSLMAPFAAMGRTDVSYEAKSSAVQPLDLDSLLDPRFGVDRTMDAALEAFNESNYHFLGLSTLLQPLPAHIRPYEYCLGEVPWDRVFHVLFSNTD